MKRSFALILFLFSILFWAPLSAPSAVIDRDLQAVLQGLNSDDEISVIVRLSEQANIRPFQNDDRRLRRKRIITALKEKAETTQRPLKEFLMAGRAKRLLPLWIINGLAITGKADLIRHLAGLPQLAGMRLDQIVKAPATQEGSATIAEWNLEVVRAPELWNLGYTGQGVVVAGMDTGVDANHPDLTARWRGGSNSWYDPHGQHPAPYDADGHGTKTMGLVVGGAASGMAIGVAPGAKWIAVKIFDDSGSASLSSIHQGFQWLLDPDNDPETDDAPDVVNNSWGFVNRANECLLEFQDDIRTLKEAGIAVVFSAGDSGPNPSTSLSPANNPEGFAVGSVNLDLDIELASSRGPSACGEGIFPGLVAPGVNVRTSDLTFGGANPNPYAIVSGTSFSAPHVSGTMALLRSAFPRLELSRFEATLKNSALNLGSAGPDNTYGYGLIDPVRAYSNLRSGLVDFGSDGRTDIGVYRLGTGAWHIVPSSGEAPFVSGWGGDLSDIPVPGDYDGDGLSDLAVYRRSDGAWWILPSSTGIGYGVGFGGGTTDIPVPGDYDGDGKTDFAVYRQGWGAWFVQPSGGGEVMARGWGGDPSDLPVPADYDGDGVTDMAIYRKSDGAWWIIPSSTGIAYGVGHGGDPTDFPVPGDYDGDGKADIAIYRQGWGAWNILPSGGGPMMARGWGGDPTDIPVAADYDGDGKTDLAIYRKSDGGWWIIPSLTERPYGVGWGGNPADIPITPNLASILPTEAG